MLHFRQIFIVLGDVAVLITAFCVMVAIRFDLVTQSSFVVLQAQRFAWLFVLWLIVFFIFDLYSIRRINPNPRTIGLIIAAVGLNTLLGVLIFYLFPQNGITPKTNLAIIAGSTFILMVAWRRAYHIISSKHFSRRIVLLGQNPLMDHLAQELRAHPHFGTVVAQWSTPPQTTDGITADLLITHGIDPQTLLGLARPAHAETLTLDEAYEFIFAKIPLELMTDDRALTYMTHHTSTPMRLVYRALEIIGASVVLILTSPLVVLSALAIWIEDGGPILYRQARVGKDGALFTMYKLRSMRTNAEHTGAQWANHNDARVTRVGRILRTTHLDEIPQMFNIIRGDLAAIGPRAERPEFVATLEQQIPYYYLRHTIKPGFTGWAQIKFRYARSIEDSKEKFEYDLYYLKNKSPLLDIGIVLKTLQIIFTH